MGMFSDRCSFSGPSSVIVFSRPLVYLMPLFWTLSVGWCWSVVSKTGEQSSSSLKDYFTCPKGFSPVYTFSMLFAFFLMVLHCWLTFGIWPDPPLQNVYWDGGVFILDLGNDVFSQHIVPCACATWNALTFSVSISSIFLWLMERNFYDWLRHWSMFIWGRPVWVMELWQVRAPGDRGRCYGQNWNLMADVTMLSCENTS